MLRCAVAPPPAVVLSSGRRGTASAALPPAGHRSRAAVCGAERLLPVSFVARRRERSARLRSIAPSSKQRGPLQPRRIVSRLADAVLKLLQPNRAADNTSVAPQEEEEVDDDQLILVAEQEPSVIPLHSPRSTRRARLLLPAAAVADAGLARHRRCSTACERQAAARAGCVAEPQAATL